MTDYFESLIEKSDRAMIIYHVPTKEVIYRNKLARYFYDKMDINTIFAQQEQPIMLMETVKDALSQRRVAHIYDVMTSTTEETNQLVDLQLDYVSQQRDTLYFKFIFKVDDRIERIKQQIDTSHRAEALLNYDENLTLYHCNELFYDVFEANEMMCLRRYQNQISNAFLPEQRDLLLQQIHAGLKKCKTFYTELQIETLSGERIWYSLDLQRRVVDDSGEKLIVYMIDIQEQVERKTELANINQYFHILQTLSKGLLYRLDIQTKTLYRNEETADFYGIASVVKDYPDPVALKSLFHEEDIPDYVSFIQMVLGGKEGSHAARMISPSGAFEYHEFNFKQLPQPDGSIKEMIGMAVNIQEKMDLKVKASYDPLTNTLNKGEFHRMAQDILENTSEIQSHAMVFLDLDDFKYVNDHLGHHFGDYLLQQVAERMSSRVRQYDLVGRVGGDEFVIFIRNFSQIGLIEQKSKEILSLVNQVISDGIHSHSIHASVGIAFYPQHGKNYEQLYQKADEALYQSKNSGKNKITIYNKTN